MLSKSRYLKGLKCTKALWLNKFKKSTSHYSEHTQRVFSQGNTAGELAQDFFPNGQLALVSSYPDSNAVRKTTALIEQGETTIYEATFVAHNTLVALDILHKIDGKWHAFEVKSTNSVKTEHMRDAAIQYYVMTNAGLEVEDISIMHFNRDYVRNGVIEPQKLFTHESVKGRVGVYLDAIPNKIEEFLAVYKNEEPTVLIGSHCDTPYACEFANYCKALPENKLALENLVEEVPLTTKVNYVNNNEVQRFLKDNPYPIYSFDFETIMHGIPEYNTSRPYQQIPFQYSLHFQKEAISKPEHFEFLGNGTDDPREGLIKSMIANLGTVGSILVYSISFEKTRIKELIRDFPKYTAELETIQYRLVDLLPIFRKHLKTEATTKSASLKVVLPTFLPELSYADLDIQNGMDTMEAYRNLAQLSSTEFTTARENMLAYCKLDTLAVLELYKLLGNY